MVLRSDPTHTEGNQLPDPLTIGALTASAISMGLESDGQDRRGGIRSRTRTKR